PRAQARPLSVPPEPRYRTPWPRGFPLSNSRRSLSLGTKRGIFPVAARTGRREVRMLVITRREGEEVVIGDPRNPIGVVRIASIKGDRVRVAFDFPRQIDVHRREIADQIIEERPQVIGAIKPNV